jgi:hypothetical protein
LLSVDVEHWPLRKRTIADLAKFARFAQLHHLPFEESMQTWVRSFLQLTRKPTAQKVDELVHLVAEKSLAAARTRLSLDISEMSAAELRGYVRARAQRTVRLQCQQVARDNGLSSESVETLVQRSLERTTQLLINQPLRQPMMPLPTAHVQLRIAG